MGKRIVVGVFGVLLFALIFVAGFGMAVQQLWNALMPPLFNLPALGFWQAVGLLALCWILFGSWRGMAVLHGGWRGARRGRMTDEERARFQAGMARRCMHGRGEAADRAGPT